MYGTLPANKIDEFYTIKPDITKTYRMREFEDDKSSPELNQYRPPGFSKGVNRDLNPASYNHSEDFGKLSGSSTIGNPHDKPKITGVHIRSTNSDPQERKLNDLLKVNLPFLDPKKIDIEQLYLDNHPAKITELEDLVSKELEMQNKKRYIDLDKMHRRHRDDANKAKNRLPESGRDVKKISQMRMEEFY